MKKNVAIIDYGAGNITSLNYALQNLNLNITITADKDKIKEADLVIFPGVGHAVQAMQQLKKTDLDQLIPSLQQPVLGICLGMQLMCSHSEEGNQLGLDIFETKVTKMIDSPKLPHMGWNQISNMKGSLFNNIKINSNVYFVHSYCVGLGVDTISTCSYGSLFSSALQKDNFYATQFHPEKSGAIGLQILKNFITLK